MKAVVLLMDGMGGHVRERCGCMPVVQRQLLLLLLLYCEGSEATRVPLEQRSAGTQR
jgi:hypothetical protein